MYTTASNRRKIERLCICDRRKLSRCTYGEMAQGHFMQNARTVHRRFQGFGVNARIPRKKPF